MQVAVVVKDKQILGEVFCFHKGGEAGAKENWRGTDPQDSTEEASVFTVNC